MKRFLSVICMALLAGGMIFTSCTNQYTITVKAEPAEGGVVEGGGSYNAQVTATLKATPNEGYEFVKWNDGVTTPTYTITVTQDDVYTAHFQKIAPGVKVTFNGSNWQAGTYQAAYYTNYHAWDVYSSQQAGALPIADVCVFSDQAGTCQDEVDATGDFDNSSPIGWIHYYEQTAIYFEEDENGNPEQLYGDWWAKNATVNITKFDATALTLSSKVDATMFHATEAFTEGGSVAGASTAPMNVTMTDCNLTSAKGSADLAKRKHHNGYAKIAQ